MRNLACLAASALGVSACSAYGAPESTPMPEPAPLTTRVCDASPSQYHIGHDATQEMGAAILKESGAATLRWGPPNTAWTMDYRQERVNVRYNEAQKITEITCG